MDNFETFFADLYSDKHKTVTTDDKNKYMQTADDLNDKSTPGPETLNNSISMEEVKSTISSLKSGKASSQDMINNEILKNLNSQHLKGGVPR